MPGPSSGQSPYRSELAGFDGFLSMVEVFVQVYDIVDGHITLGYDCTSAEQQATGDWPLTTSQPSFDLLQDICHRIAQCPIKFIGEKLMHIRMITLITTILIGGAKGMLTLTHRLSILPNCVTVKIGLSPPHLFFTKNGHLRSVV